MKKQLSILSLGILLTGYNLGFAQETKIQPCNTYAAMEELFALDPSAKANFEANQKKLQEEYLNYSNNQAGNKTAAVEYTIPVVFHILHQGGAENIDDSVCVKALAEVNRVYARKTVDTASIFTPFKSLYIPSDIKFMLAKKDLNGNCITGIVHHVDAKTQWQQTQANASTAYWPYTWDPTRYLNVYIVANIVPQGTVTGGGIIVGYTYLAGTWPSGSTRDAVVYRYNFLSPNAPSYDARSLAHEMGHWLSLAHTFGNTNNPGVSCGSTSGGDGVADTPDTKGSFGNCPASSTNTNYTCTSPDPSNSNLYYQNVQNIMDYSGCPRNFTTGQTNKMRSTLGSNVSGRNNVVSSSNLIFTDVNGVVPCSPIAEFLSTTNSYTICAGASLTMKDYSYNGTITTYQWAADNGAVIAAPTSTLTGILFNTVGVSNVTLTVSNAQGTSTKVRTVTVVNSAAGITGTYVESFENPGLPNNWSTNDIPVTAPVTWQQTSAASYDGLNSFYINGPSTQGGQINQLQMPIIDLLNNQGSSFSFAYAYARKATTQNDFFRVQFSSDCGGSWTDVVIKNAATMASETGGGTTAVSYTPTAKSEWKVVDVSGDYAQWNSYTSSASVLIRFSFEEYSVGGGNNFYLDAVNFTGSTGINELTKSIKLSMYPNPTTGETNLKFSLNDASVVKMNVVDILGKEVLPASSLNLNAGEQTIVVNKENILTRGIYFVNLSVNGAKMSRKLIIN